MASVDEVKLQLVRAARALFDHGVMSHSGHGNLSARVDGERLVITSVGQIRDLSPADLAVVTLDGKVLEGHLDPSTSEIVAMHTGVYRTREGVGSVIHTHSPNVTVFAVANQPLPSAYEAMLRFGVTDAVPVAPWAPRGSRESVTNITDQMRSHPSVPAVLLGNHGLLAFTDDAVGTARLIVAMEEGAELVLKARAALGGEKPFPAGAFEKELAHMAAHGSRPGGR
ncbi:MAG TPA: class II aldolase/adducin family protein [Bacillota bacterium]|nr:class II aldolase/adducin family protein [Bacillota bacterium]